jgi:hypothetical protein
MEFNCFENQLDTVHQLVKRLHAIRGGKTLREILIPKWWKDRFLQRNNFSWFQHYKSAQSRVLLNSIWCFMCPQFLTVTKKSMGGGAPVLETFAEHKLIKLSRNFIVLGICRLGVDCYWHFLQSCRQNNQASTSTSLSLHHKECDNTAVLLSWPCWPRS